MEYYCETISIPEDFGEALLQIVIELEEHVYGTLLSHVSIDGNVTNAKRDLRKGSYKKKNFLRKQIARKREQQIENRRVLKPSIFLLAANHGGGLQHIQKLFGFSFVKDVKDGSKQAGGIKTPSPYFATGLAFLSSSCQSVNYSRQH